MFPFYGVKVSDFTQCWVLFSKSVGTLELGFDTFTWLWEQGLDSCKEYMHLQTFYQKCIQASNGVYNIFCKIGQTDYSKYDYFLWTGINI